MSTPSPLTEQIFGQLRALAAGEPTPQRLDGALRLLSKWRAHLIQATVLKSAGTRVSGGPFAGLDFLESSAEGCHVPKLLGTYEQPLHAAIEDAIGRGYSLVINIGCAEGYYAVGLARRMPAAHIVACDLNETARRVCAELAARNGVADRIEVRAEFRLEDFAPFAGSDALVVCDIEGAEQSLLDPAAAPALLGLDVIVEAHDCFAPNLSAMLAERFEATHHVTVIRDHGERRVERPPPWFAGLGHLDQLLAVWEWRGGPTPWLVMRRRNHSRQSQEPGSALSV